MVVYIVDFKIRNNVKYFNSLIPESLLLSSAFLLLILTGLPGCANTDNCSDGTCSSTVSRVKKCFLFHKDKCSPHPYYSLDGYQTNLDKMVVKHAAKKCAHQSLKNLSCQCKDKPSKAFRKGYREAYIDIALGDSGTVPPVPPEEYWAAHYRTPAGYIEIQEWFTGYKLGAEHALADGRQEYSKISTPYALTDWNHPESDQWSENMNYPQNTVTPDTSLNYAPPAPMSDSHHNPQQPKLMIPNQQPAPAPQPEIPSQPIPQRHHTLPPPPKIPKHTHPQIHPALPKPQIHNQPPIVAPKPPLGGSQVPSSTKNHHPAIRNPARPAYINDDPPPNPYSLQSYPYTPLPQNMLPSNQYRHLDYRSAPNGLPYSNPGQSFGNRY